MQRVPELHPALRSYSEVWSNYTREERHTLAHVKRFCECLVGDPVFRQKLEQHIDTPRVVADEYGLDVDPELMRPLFQVEYFGYRFESATDRWPLAKMWDQHFLALVRWRDKVVEVGDPQEINPRFSAWRRRQIYRLNSEVGFAVGSSIVHPIAAYEISQGCTMGCWFCGISAEKFKGYFKYTRENEEIWRGCLEAMVERFGAAVQTGFLYWATDPADNPDYVQFVESHRDITGSVPQTTTANPLRDVAQTRHLLALSAAHHAIPNRFSILSVGQLRKVHATFTADELAEVELVLQNKGSLMGKSRAGKAMEREAAKSAAAETKAAADQQLMDGTIACVSGFLVNFVEGSVRLVSPTRASERWPDGYRVYGQASFSDAHEFAGAIDELMEVHMSGRLGGKDQLAFREDLEYEALADGFRVKNDRSAATLSGQPWYRSIGGSVAEGGVSLSRVLGRAVADGASPFEAAEFVNDLYRIGLLDDDPLSGRIVARRRVSGSAMVDAAAPGAA